MGRGGLTTSQPNRQAAAGTPAWNLTFTSPYIGPQNLSLEGCQIYAAASLPLLLWRRGPGRGGLTTSQPDRQAAAGTPAWNLIFTSPYIDPQNLSLEGYQNTDSRAGEFISVHPENGSSNHEIH